MARTLPQFTCCIVHKIKNKGKVERGGRHLEAHPKERIMGKSPMYYEESQKSNFSNQ